MYRFVRATGSSRVVGVALAVSIAGCSANGNGGAAPAVLSAPLGPQVTLSVEPQAIQANETAVITWSSKDATHCVASGSWNGAQALTSGSGLNTGPKSAGTYSYGLTCTGAGGSGTAVRTLIVGQGSAPEVSLSLDRSTIRPGDTAKLTWTSLNATSCAGSGGSGSDGWSGARNLSDTKGLQVGPFNSNSSISYTLECVGAAGTASDSRILTVSSSAPPAPPAVSLSASPSSIQPGQSVTLAWTSSRADSCAASGGTGADGWSGSKPLSSSGVLIGPLNSSGSYSYTLTCTGAGGSIGSTASVVVSSGSQGTGAAVDVSLSPATITAGTAAALSWTSTGVDTCTASGSWSGSKPTAATNVSTGVISSVGSYSYTLTCTGPGGSVTDTSTLTVDPPPASVLSFSATPANIHTGESSSLSWSTLDATSCTGSGGTGSDGWAGGKPVSSNGLSVGPFASAGTYNYSLSCTGPGGSSSVQSLAITVTAPTPPATVTAFNATPSSITVGGSTTLTWATSNATSCTASGGTGSDGWGGSAPTSSVGSVIGPFGVAGTYTYTLVCSGPGGVGSPASVTVAVGAGTPPATIDAFSGLPTTITAGQSTTLSWTTSNATSCAASNGAGGDGWGGAVAASSGGTVVGPIASAGTYTYSLVCSGAGGASGLSSVAITVVPATQPATITSFTATPNSIQAGQSTSISWSSANATSCTASGGAGGDGWSGTIAASSAGMTVGPIHSAGTYSYSLVCTGAGGASATSTISVAVSAAPVGAPTITLLANDSNPAQMQPGQPLVMKWTTTNATSCTASGGTGVDSWAGARPTASTGLSLGAINTQGVYTYSLSCTGPGGTSSASVPVTVVSASTVDCGIGPASIKLLGPAASVSSSVNGFCLAGCSVSNASRVIDADPDNYATMNVSLGIAAYDTLRVTDGSTSYPAGRKAGFLIAEPGHLLSLGLLSNVTIRTLLNGAQQESATAATILELSALGSQSDPAVGFVGFTTTKAFNAVRIDVGSLASLNSTVNVYGACVTMQ